jgi:uncharacterized membrane protein YGL010W
MDRKFLKDCVKVLVIVVAGGFILGTLAHIFRVEQPTYVTNVTQPCIIAPVTVPVDHP